LPYIVKFAIVNEGGRPDEDENDEVYKKRPSIKACDCLLIKQFMQKKKKLFWCKKVKTSCALASENKDAYLLRKDTVWGPDEDENDGLLTTLLEGP
jgi:hypothetical protein